MEQSISTHLTLFLPNFLTVARAQPFPILGQLLGKADFQSASLPSLADLYGFSGYPLPIAPLTALADGIMVNPGEWWLRADPVRLEADQSTVYLVDTPPVQQNVLDSLVPILNTFLAQDGLQLLAPNSKRWYIQLANDPQFNSLNPQVLIGQSIKAYLSVGEQHSRWRRLFTELQILLHQQNTAINGLWFWGQGYLPKCPAQKYWHTVWSNNALERGIALWSGAAIQPLPAQFIDCLGSMQAGGNYLIVLEDVAVDDLMLVEARWFAPLLAALEDKQLANITFYTEKGCFNLDSRSLKKWWRFRYRF